jgi:hypothetical protein
MGQMKHPIILIGYPGSQRIVPASKYLTSKYLPGFNITYLNYQGPIGGWASYIIGFLRYLTDEYVIFSLDDYLIAGPIDMEVYERATSELGGDVACVKLCESTEQEHAEYPVTTQYCIWNREYLIRLLANNAGSIHCNTPWEFEINGSRIFDKQVLLRTCIPYFTNSSLSGRWEGVRLDGLNDEDINHIKSHGLI